MCLSNFLTVSLQALCCRWYSYCTSVLHSAFCWLMPDNLKSAILRDTSWSRGQNMVNAHCLLNMWICPHFLWGVWATHTTLLSLPSDGQCSICLVSSEVSWVLNWLVFPIGWSVVKAPFFPLVLHPWPRQVWNFSVIILIHNMWNCGNDGLQTFEIWMAYHVDWPRRWTESREMQKKI
jgi:hypothetical protein